MELNPYESPPTDVTQSLTPTPQAVHSIRSIPGDIIGSWLPFGMVTFLLLPSLHELPKANIGLIAFELSIIVISLTIGIFVTLKRTWLLTKWLISRFRRRGIAN